ncbi:MAG TPA: thiamine-phosphate kinase [Terriglobales bacterium]|nr:thiamine-phosphate kinase [Terriglobales bacterium]
MSALHMPLAEKALIARIRSQVKQGRGVITGIGDDCAVLRIPPDHEALVTTDFSLEGIHFRREWHPAESVGHRCLTRGLSDIAAMGGEPIAAFVSLALPRDLPQSWVNKFSKGLLKLADGVGVSLAGGDTAQSLHGILADVMVLGSVPKGKAILRSAARAGDRIYVSGELGGSAATLDRLRSSVTHRLNPSHFPQHFWPQPRLALGRLLRDRSLASAMIDISDGLSTDLTHICEESGMGAEILAEAVPRASIGKHSHEVDFPFALHGGEDYELLFTVPAKHQLPSRLAGVPITEIGYIIQNKKIIFKNADGKKSRLEAKGWQHFKNRK